MTPKEKRSALATDGTKFTIGTCIKVFEMSRYIEDTGNDTGHGLSVKVEGGILDSMNLLKIGTKRITFYSYTLFGDRVTSTFRLADITITEVGTEKTEA